MTLGFMYNVQISQWVGIPSCRNRNQVIIKISCLLQLWLFIMVSTKTEPLITISTQLFHHFSFSTQVNVYKPLRIIFVNVPDTYDEALVSCFSFL